MNAERPLNVSGFTLMIEDIYQPGQRMTAAEARILNSVRALNIAQNLRGQLARGSLTAATFATEAPKYAASYSLNPPEPVFGEEEREAFEEA